MKVSSLWEGLLTQQEAGTGENSKDQEMQSGRQMTERNAVTEKEIKFIEPSQQYLQPASSAKMFEKCQYLSLSSWVKLSAQHQITR